MIGKIDPRDRDTLRLHGWLLMLWVCGVGFCANALMLYELHVHSMGIRYSVGAGSMYFLGFVFGGWWYLRRWKQVGPDISLPQHAKPDDQLAYDEEQKEIEKKFSWMGDLTGFGGDDPISAIIGLIFLLACAVGLLVLLWYVPMLVTDSLAGFLAEIVLEFVIGMIIYRRTLKPRESDEYLGFVMKRTWAFGLLLAAMCGGAGYGLQSLHPQANTLFEVLKQA
jgi:hypothetical protein